MSMKARDLSGLQIGEWKIIERDRDYPGLGIKWICECSCGKIKSVKGCSLLKGESSSCCRKLFPPKYGSVVRFDPEYVNWCQMKQRCFDTKSPNYKNYGAKGITVCPQWINDYAQFLTDVGRRPTPKHSLDRWPNQKGNYEPSNCRWATSQEQNRNRNNNRLITFAGKTLPLAEWGDRQGISARTIATRLDQLGWSLDRAMTEPANV